MQSSKYGRILNMGALHSTPNMLEYALTEFWIYPRFEIWKDFEYGRVLNMQELHMVLHLNMSEYAITDRVLNMSPTVVRSMKSLYKLMSIYWEMVVFRVLSRI